MRLKKFLKNGFANKLIVCDSAEPKSINDLRMFGLRVRGARKGPDSIEYGIRFLQSLEKIVIDPERCPNVTREFSDMSLNAIRTVNLSRFIRQEQSHH